MSKQSRRLINFEDQILFHVAAGGSYTIPKIIDVDSPQDDGSGLVANTFDTKRNVAGGMIIAKFENLPVSVVGTTDREVTYPLKPGDVVAVSAVVSNAANVSVNGVVVFTIGDGATTTVAGIVGYYA